MDIDQTAPLLMLLLINSIFLQINLSLGSIFTSSVVYYNIEVVNNVDIDFIFIAIAFILCRSLAAGTGHFFQI